MTYRSEQVDGCATAVERPTDRRAPCLTDGGIRSCAVVRVYICTLWTKNCTTIIIRKRVRWMCACGREPMPAVNRPMYLSTTRCGAAAVWKGGSARARACSGGVKELVHRWSGTEGGDRSLVGALLSAADLRSPHRCYNVKRAHSHSKHTLHINRNNNDRKKNKIILPIKKIIE